MERMFNWINVSVGVVGGFLAGVLGGVDSILTALIIFVIADYVTGVIKACCKKQLSSEIGYKGIFKKLAIFVVVAVGFTVQKYVITTIPLREMTIFFYIANEGISLLENLAEVIPVPGKLKEILLQLKEK